MDYELVSYWSQMAAFVLFVGVLIWTWQQYVMPAVTHAQQVANERIALSERHRNEMQAALEGLRHEIDGAHLDAERINTRAANQAQREYDKTLAEAAESGERELRNAGGELERARVASQQTLRDEFLAQALARAHDDAAKKVDAALNAILIDRFLAELEKR